MAGHNLIITESDHVRFSDALDRLGRDANAKFVFLIDRAGQQIASAGDLDAVDATALASLTASNVAATEGVAQLVGQGEFTSLCHEGRRESLHISLVEDRVILLVVFDELSSTGLVRLRVEQHAPTLAEIMRDMVNRGEGGGASEGGTPFGDLSVEDIDALFG